MAQAALARCQLEATEHPDSAAARFNLGVALGESGDLRGSIEAYEHALRLDADDADTHYNLALCYETLGPEGTERAIAAYRRTLALAPSADAWTNLGVLLKATADVDGAVAAHTAAFALDEGLREGYAVRLVGLEQEGAFGALAVGAGAVWERWGPALREAAALLRGAGYGERAAIVAALGLSGASASGWPTGTDYFAMRLDADVQARLRAEGDGARLRLLLRLFLLGCPVPQTEAQTTLGAGLLDALSDCGLLAPSRGAAGCLISPVQLYPLYCPVPSQATLLLATDWPIDTLLPGRDAVMAIGTDSLELVRHPPRPATADGRWLDLCCGSGVQGLAAVHWRRCAHATCVDINPRAAHFTRCNAALNQLADERLLTVLLGDLYEPIGEAKFDAVLANPPFVAVPSFVAALPPHQAWALFAAGGPAGDEVLRRIVQGAAAHSQPDGWLGIVTEVPNVEATPEWLAPLLGCGRTPGRHWAATVLYNAADVVPAQTYAEERAAERGWQGGEAAEAWKRAMAETAVKDMTSALIYGRGVGASGGFELDEFGGEGDDFMLGDGAAFVEGALRRLCSGGRNQHASAAEANARNE